jgi:hypothetical protein
MVMIKANQDSEAGKQGTKEQFEEMAAYNEQLVKAGVMLAGEGLLPSSKGARVRFSGSKRTVVDGPFTESKELIAGFWILQVKSKEEAIEWVKRVPDAWDGKEAEIEIRQIAELEDLPMTPELKQQFDKMREQIERR